MSDSVTVRQIIEHLKASKTNTRCSELKEHLEQLGFEVRDGKKGGHKVFTHDGLAEFASGSFNCGHGKNPAIKPAYITKVIRLLEVHEDDL